MPAAPATDGAVDQLERVLGAEPAAAGLAELLTPMAKGLLAAGAYPQSPLAITG